MVPGFDGQKLLWTPFLSGAVGITDLVIWGVGNNISHLTMQTYGASP